MGKITVKHFVNIDLKPVGKLYPLYVQVIYNRKVFRFKSTSSIFEYVDNGILEVLNKNGFLSTEVSEIERTIQDMEKLNIEVTSKNISKYSKPFFHVLEDNFCKLIEAEIKEAPDFFTTKTYTEIINVVNFVDGNSFYNYSNAVDTIHSISQNMGVWDMKDRADFLGIDFYGGSKYDEVLTYFEAYYGSDRNTEIIQETIIIFKNFIDL